MWSGYLPPGTTTLRIYVDKDCYSRKITVNPRKPMEQLPNLKTHEKPVKVKPIGGSGLFKKMQDLDTYQRYEQHFYHDTSTWKLDRYMREEYHEGYKLYKEHFVKLKNCFTYLASQSNWPYLTQAAVV